MKRQLAKHNFVFSTLPSPSRSFFRKVVNDITETPDVKPKSLSRKYTKAKAKEYEQRYINKKMHGYYYRKLQQNDNIDISVSQQRFHTKQITSQFEGYLGAIQDQEMPTKYLVHKIRNNNR